LNGFSVAFAASALETKRIVRSAAANPARTAQTIRKDPRKERIAASMISVPDGVDRMAGGDIPRSECRAVGEIDTMIKKFARYPQKRPERV